MEAETTGAPGQVECPWCRQIIDDPDDVLPDDNIVCRRCRKPIEIAKIQVDVTVTLRRA